MSDDCSQTGGDDSTSRPFAESDSGAVEIFLLGVVVGLTIGALVLLLSEE